MIKMITAKKAEQLLLQLTIFLIPTNLAYHVYTSGAYLNGRLVDYFLPKLYLSDLTLLGVLLIYVFINSNLFHISTFIRFIIRSPWTYFLIFLILKSATSPVPIAGFWYVFKIIEFLLFGWYLYHRYTRFQFLSLIRFPLSVSLVLQCSIGLYQFISQSSFIGYIFMGEPSLERAAIVKNNYFGVLEVSPYGTTPHPNVLAGFLCIGLLVQLICIHSNLKSTRRKAALVALIGLICIVILLTQSLGAIGAFLVGISLLFLKNKVSILNMRLIVLMCIGSSLILGPLLIYILRQYPQLADNASITTRYELNHSAITQLLHNSLSGSGPNQFIYYLPRTTFSGQKTLFLQPAHNLSLLVLAETGLAGLLFGVWCINRLFKQLKWDHTEVSYLVPLLALLLIGAVDHYPLTLQTGQMLLTICSVLPFLSHAKSKTVILS